MGFTSNTLFSPATSGLQQAWVNSALAVINPNKPVIQLPLFLWELREFPKMLRDLGRVLQGGSRLSDLPGAHLAWQFGWAPLLQDLGTLINLAFEIEEQQRRFHRMMNSKRRYGTILDEDGISRYGTSTGAVGVSESWCYIRHTRKVWWCAIWEPQSDVPTFPLNGAFEQYKRALGLNQPASMLWNAVPWSFAIDYFVNVSSYLEATEGIGKFKPATICFMERADETIDSQGVTTSASASGSYTPGSFSRKTRARYVRSDPHARITWAINPVTDRLPILTSLVTSRKLRQLRL
jgi:hypothetical protein